MITFNIIKGYKLILWAERLNFQPSFTQQLDKYGYNYVQEIEQTDTDQFTLIVLAKLRNSNSPLSIIFTCNELQLKSIVEKVRLEDEEFTQHT